MLTLHRESGGAGESLVVLHGWGLHSGIWDEIAPRLRQRFRVTLVDLPGHGRSPAPEKAFGLAEATAALAETLPGPSHVLGWSLGGTVALSLARHRPHLVHRLVLVGATPCFQAAPGWPCGLAPHLLEEFAANLGSDFRKTVMDFLTLQVRGDRQAASLLRSLRERVFAHGEPSPAALADGLGILERTDLRPDLPRIACPALVISGQRDRLTPAEAGRRMARALPRGRFVEIPGASHAPFLSHPRSVLETVTGFLDGGEAREASG